MLPNVILKDSFYTAVAGTVLLNACLHQALQKRSKITPSYHFPLNKSSISFRARGLAPAPLSTDPAEAGPTRGRSISCCEPRRTDWMACSASRALPRLIDSYSARCFMTDRRYSAV